MKFLFSYQIIAVLDFRHSNWGTIDFLNYYTTTNKNFETVIVFYPHSKICKNQPKEYINYSRLKYIIGRSKLFIEKPSNLNNQAATWRDYKHHNTN